jgi:hypothetical protein
MNRRGRAFLRVDVIPVQTVTKIHGGKRFTHDSIPSSPWRFLPQQNNWPSTVTAPECSAPQLKLLISIPSKSDMNVGLLSSLLPPSPSLPDAPLPHENKRPSRLNATEWKAPHAMERMGGRPGTRAGASEESALPMPSKPVENGLFLEYYWE